MKNIIFIFVFLSSIKIFAQPANDECATPTAMGTLPTPGACAGGLQDGATLTFAGQTTVGATPSLQGNGNTYQSILDCEGTLFNDQAGPALDVWYSFVPTGSIVNINITGFASANFGVWTGACNNLQAVGCSTDGSIVMEQMNAGQTYYLQVSGSNATGTDNSFTINIDNDIDCNDCFRNGTLTVNPLPVNGTYVPGTAVSFCFHIDQWQQTLTNWLHGVQMTFGNGWDLGSLTTTAPGSYGGSGAWAYYPGGTTATLGTVPTGDDVVWPAGFYYNTGAVNNPGNNFGDPIPAGNTTTVYNIPAGEWNFCWSITTAVACNPGASLNVSVNTSGDGESGGWDDAGCGGDPPTNFIAATACCPPTIAATPVSCFGGTNGTATATPVGANGPYTYNWSGPAGYTNNSTGVAGASNVTGLAAGTYTVDVIDVSSCLQTVTVTVTQPTQIAATVTPTNPTCTAAGSIAVTALSGGTSPYDISLDNGSTYVSTNVTANQNYTGQAAGTYTVFIRDANNCTRTFTTTLTATGSVVASFTPPAAQCLTGNNYSFTPLTTGSTAGSIVAGTTTYDFDFGDGTNPAATTATGAQTHTYAAAATYTVSLTITSGTCSNTFTAAITVNPMPATPTATLTQPTCGLNNGAINITGPGTTYSFNGGAYSATTSYTNLGPGTYTVSVRNGTTCTTTTQFTLTNIPGPTDLALSSATAHCSQADGSVTIGAVTGGVATYLYTINGAATAAGTFGSMAPATYTIVVTDGNNCTYTENIVVANAGGPTAQTITPTSANCGTATGQIVFGATTGGSAAYTYSFNGGAYSSTTTYTNLLPGTYNAGVTDNFGCTYTTTVTVANNPGPTNLVLTPAPANCGSSNGQITIGAVTGGGGGNTFSFNAGPFTATSPITNLAAGTYTVTVRDVNGCTFTQTTTVTSSSGPTDVVLTTAPANCGASNGSVTIGAVTGGAGAMTYSFDGGAFNATTLYTGQTATTHTVIVQDGNGCQYTETVAVASNVGPTALAVTSTPSDCAPNNGTVTIGVVTGGTGPFVYDFNGSGFTGTTNYTGIAAGTYPVSVRDANGCVFATTITVDPSLPPTAQATSTTNSTCGNPNGVVTIGATTGGTGPYTFSFNGGGFSATTSYTITAGTYNVIVRDSKGCTFTTTATVADTPGPTAVVLTPTNSTCGNNNGSVTVGAVTTSGSTSFQYSIDGGALQAGTGFINLSATTHTVLVQDANGCQFSQTVAVANTPGPTAQVVTPTNSTCGNTNGSLNVGATTGGTPTITFQLDLAGAFTTTTNYTNLAAGTHTITVSDANGCLLTVNPVIGNTAGPTAVALTQTPANCGAANGVITVGAVTGGTSAFQYSIDGGTTYQASTSFNSLLPATYTVTVKDANNCLVTNTITVGNVGAPTVVLTAQTNVSCNGGSDGTATFTAAGGAGGFTYTLNTGTSNLTGIFTNLALGTYTVTVIDAATCSATQTVSITQPTLLTGSIITQADPLCNAGTNGSLTVGGLNGTPAYQYSLNGGAFGASGAFTGLTAGVYTVTVRDNNGCTFPVPVTLSQPTVVSVVMSSVNANCTAANGTATATAAGGTGGYTYAWTPAGGTGATTIGVVAGNYSVTVTDANNCTATGNTAIGITPGGTATISSVTQVSCNGGSDGSITVSMSATAATSYSYTWTPSGGNAATASGLTTGTYTVNITDNFGCTATANAAVTEPLPLTLTFVSTNVSCNGGNDGTISATVNGGTLSYNYVWSPFVGATANISSLPIGTYSLTVTDAHGCTVTGTRTITEPTLLTITPVVASSHCNQSDGSISVTGSGGAGTYSFALNAGAFINPGDFTNLAAGTYTITIKDNNNCTQAYPVTITDLAGPVATITASTNVLCNGGCDGTATVNVVGGIGPYTYAWQNGSVTTSATNLCAGIYTVSATDQNGCVASTGVTITEPTLLIANASGVDPKCNGGNNGTGTAGALGGTPGAGYSYSWTTIPAQLSANATGLSAGPYNVIVTDANGCTATTSINLVDPPALTASITTVNLSCFNQCIGSAAAIIGNATLPIQYTWTGGQTTQTASGLCAGSYTVNITDANNCTATSSTTITEPTQLVAAILTSGNESCFNTNDAFAQGSASGGTANYTYTWSNSFVGANNINLDAGTYTLTVTDNNGCTDQEQVVLTAPPALTLSVTKTDITCNYAPPYPPICDGGAFATVGGGTGPYMYHWTPSQYTVNNPVTLCAGSHTVVVTDDNGCKDSTTIFINEPPEFTIALTADSSHCLFADGATNVVITGGATPHTIAWSNGVATPYNPGLVGGQYTIAVTDAIGCQVLSSTVVNDIDGPTVSVIDSTMITCFGANNGTALASVFGGTLPYQSLGWVETTQPGLSASNLPGGFATIAVYDSAGCFGGDQVFIMEPTDVVTGIVSYQDVTCYNLFNGSTVVQANGGFYDPSDASEINAYTISLYNPLQTQAGIAPNTSVNFAGLGVGPIGSSVTYTVMVTDMRGCKDSTTVIISQPQALVISNPTETDISCFGLSDGEISVTATGGTPVYSYNWTSTNVGFVNPGTPAISGLEAGSYTLSLVDFRGCTDNQIATIDEPTQVLLDSTVSTASCGLANGSATVIATGGTPGYTYLWNNVPNSVLSSANSLSANLYHCDVTDLNGCAIGIDVVVPNAAGPTEANMGTYSAKCFGQATGALDVDATGGTAPLVYTWTTAGGTQLVSGPVPNDSISGIMAGTYAVHVQDANGCFFNSVAVVAQPSQVILVASTDQTICYGDSTQISANVGGGTPPYSWTWTHNSIPVPALTSTSGSLSNGPHWVRPSYTTPLHTYGVMVVDVNGCIPIAGQTIDVTALPPIMMTAQSYTVCNNDLVSLSANATGGNTSAGGTITYSWTPGGMTDPNPTVTAQDDPDHQQIFTVTASDGCSKDTSVNHTIFINPTPTASLIGSNLAGCADLDVSFSGSGGAAFPNCVYEWSFGDNTEGFGALISHTYTTNGLQSTSYDVELTVTTPLGCVDVVTMPAYVTVYPNPIAAFTYNPLNTTEFDPLISFYDRSSLASTYEWNFGELTSLDNVSVLQNPTHNYEGPGLYDINLLVTSINGCVDDVTHQIYIEPEFAIYVPNAFSPNEDGKNESFFPQGIGIDEERFQMFIFDRWGEIIFQSNSLSKGWDGKVNGKSDPVQEDVYIWKIMAYDIKNNKHNLTGHVTVVR
ncbi:MAG: PKD domain-containing protein [Bacteroidota bacterium]|nr:PKD domain-containing protein [Bacteroidota bacterium]